MCFKKKTDGTIFVDLSGEAEAPIQLVTNIGLVEMTKRKYLTFKVDAKDPIEDGMDVVMEGPSSED